MQSTTSFQLNDLSRNSFNPLSPELFDIISYPRFEVKEYLDRIKEIESFGVKSIISSGRLEIGRFEITGKGCVGLVVRSKSHDNRICALKIRRVDANRCDMHQEVRLHTIANSVGIGPKILDHSRNVILMEFVEGLSIADWIEREDNIADSETVLRVVSDILKQCHVLDKIHLDHGQLSYLNHHVIISKSAGVTIIDFESASELRRTSNVTCASHSLLLGGCISEKINDILCLQNKKERLIHALKLYKLSQSGENFEKILYLLQKDS
jgi:putative serine/threonine protein kinase